MNFFTGLEERTYPGIVGVKLLYQREKKGLSWFCGGDDTEIIFVNAKEGRRTEGHSGTGCILDLLIGRVATRTSAP